MSKYPNKSHDGNYRVKNYAFLRFKTIIAAESISNAESDIIGAIEDEQPLPPEELFFEDSTDEVPLDGFSPPFDSLSVDSLEEESPDGGVIGSSIFV